MKTLTETLKDDVRREAVVRDGAHMIDEEVRKRGGLSGMALRTGYKTVKKLKPGIIEQALTSLLPDFAPAVDPFFLEGRATGDVAGHFRSNGSAIADALLAVTDQRAARAKNRVIKKAYQSLRGQAKGHVVESLPRLAELIERHVPEA
jgi:hypothetical protein